MISMNIFGSYYVGRKTTRRVRLIVDREAPTHCTNSTGCRRQMLSVGRPFTTSVRYTVGTLTTVELLWLSAILAWYIVVKENHKRYCDVTRVRMKRVLQYKHELNDRNTRNVAIYRYNKCMLHESTDWNCVSIRADIGLNTREQYTRTHAYIMTT